MNNYEFISRGDDSGTNKKEVDLWKSINVDPTNYSSWYLEVGQGMGNTLLIAKKMRGLDRIM